MDSYTVLFLIFFTLAGIALYFVYLHEKGDRLKEINEGICPKCKNKTIEIVDQRSHGCSGTKEVTIECTNCGYKDSFTISGGGCGSGKCGI
ncbi:MAG: hypothetical protein GXO31_00515 [Epsilonproteobacteria bacterium]|nr:hypothetical protein [Campylobacterota bacterium]